MEFATTPGQGRAIKFLKNALPRHRSNDSSFDCGEREKKEAYISFTGLSVFAFFVGPPLPISPPLYSFRCKEGKPHSSALFLSRRMNIQACIPPSFPTELLCLSMGVRRRRRRPLHGQKRSEEEESGWLGTSSQRYGRLQPLSSFLSVLSLAICEKI